MVPCAPVIPPTAIPFAGYGPVGSLGANASEAEWAAREYVGGIPSAQYAVVLSAPAVPFRLGLDQIALLPGPVRVPALDLQTWRAVAPPIPLNARPQGRIVLQINGPNVSQEIIVLAAPRVPTSGAAPCQVGRSS